MGRVDLFHSRRINYIKCEYWIRDERNASGNASNWILNHNSSGTFYARPISPKSHQMNVVNNVWALDKDYVTLETDEEVDDLKRGCIIKYNNELWIVDNIQRHLHLKEQEFCKNPDYRHIISITRG